MFAFLRKIFSIVLSFILGFATYPISYLPFLRDSEFDITTGSFSAEAVTLNGKEEKIILGEGVALDGETLVLDSKAEFSFKDTTHGWFNYYGITYSSDAYIKGEINYRCGAVNRSEEFFLEPGENKSFYSFINNMLKGTKANMIYSLSFTALDKENAK